MPTKENPLLGVGMMALAMLLLPMGDAVAKYLTDVTDYGPGFLGWSRFLVGAAALAPLAFARGEFRGLGWRFVRAQALRGALVGGAITLIITAVQTVPLADAYGAFFIGPCLATVLAATVLRERVGPLEWIAVGLGLIGVSLVLRPTGGFSVGLLWALGAGACYGSFLVTTRWAATSGPALAQLAGQLLFGALILAPLGVGDLVTHGVQAPGWLLLSGAFSAGANFLSILALGRARAAYLAPVVYVQIIGASATSFVVFGDVVDGAALFGLTIIVCAGLTRVPWRLLDSRRRQ